MFVLEGMPSFAGWSDSTRSMNGVFNVEESSELLTPLAGTPSPSWRSKAKLALDHGYSFDDVAGASIHSTRFTTGSISKMWEAERLAFETLLDDPDWRVGRVAKSGVEYAAERERQAARIERRGARLGMKSWL